MKKETKRYLPLFLGLALLLGLLGIFSITQGDANISLAETIAIISNKILKLFGRGVDLSSPKEIILFNIRIPRILASGIVGAGLAGVGCAYQGVFRNSMADPYILGISSGATLGAAIAISLGSSESVAGFGIVTLASFIGALVATFLVYSLAMRHNRISMTSLLLSGVAVSYFLSSLVSLILVFNEKDVSKIVYWTMGSLAGVSYSQLYILIPSVLIGSLLLYANWRELDILSSGEEIAQSLGVQTNRLKIQMLVYSSLIVAVSVAFTGVIGFVGLMMPHIMRMIVGPSHRRLIPFSMISGALFLLMADTIARSLIDSAELPVGAVTALFGAPYFIWLLARNKRGDGA
ncbi:MAG: iron ABC transporter permease [Clostridiaceae bacterium]